jgi:chorismate mutase-like protein
MSDDKLTELRDKIDAIDNELIDLLVKRADIVAEVAETKGKLPVYIRPGREATMLRNLMEKDTGRLSKQLIHRLWREMIGAFTLQEGALRVAVPEGEQGFWDLARDHFGSFTPMLPYESNTEALRAVFMQEVQAAALPLPQESKDVWWRMMLNPEADGINIFYRFPFDGQRNNARDDAHDGVVVGVLGAEDTGHDVTLLGVEWKPEVTKAQATKLAEELSKKVLLHVFGTEDGAPPCSYIKLQGFLKSADAALKNWLEAHKGIILRARVIGAYPMPYAA